MGIRVSLSDAKVPSTEPQEILIAIEVDDKGGGGGTIQADVDSTFPTADFSYVCNSASPALPNPPGGSLSWKDQTIEEKGTTFSYRITCTKSASGGLVTAQACLAGSTTTCAMARDSVSC